eukprot:3555946-Alexandrium_andersonii.AAC.1
MGLNSLRINPKVNSCWLEDAAGGEWARAEGLGAIERPSDYRAGGGGGATPLWLAGRGRPHPLLLSPSRRRGVGGLDGQ